MKSIRLSLQDFAQPSPRTGSIEGSSGFSFGMQKGIELHQLIQAQRLKDFDTYQAEVRIQRTFVRDGFTFEVEGRMDGIFRDERPVIEEIKSSFNIYDLSRKLRERTYSHPYYLQLLSYGYFYYLEHGVIPQLTFLLVSSRRSEELDLQVQLDLKEYQQWLDRRLSALVLEATQAQKRSKRRSRLSSELPFPFPVARTGQRELIEYIDASLTQQQRVMVQAPTGLGKTVGVLYPTLKESLSRGQRVIYITPKNSQQLAAEEAIERIQAKGCPTRSLTITAKSKLCMKAEALCNPEYCEFARDYYDKLELHGLKEILGKKKKLTSKVFKNLAQKYEVCPFELQFEAVEEPDTIICDYNYVLGHDSALGRLSQVGFSQEGKPNLVIDEAHNIPSRTMSYYSPSISTRQLKGMEEELKSLQKRFSEDGVELVQECVQLIEGFKGVDNKNQGKRLNLESGAFLEVNERIKAYMSKYLESDVEIRPRDVVLRFSFYWGEFTEILSTIMEEERPEFFISSSHDQGESTIHITCCDASKLIQPRYDNFEHVVAFSATLKPFEYYSQLSGLEGKDLFKKEFESPFNTCHRKIIVIPQVSTKYSVRAANYPKIADTIHRVVQVRPGNYLAFFPSFDFMERTLGVFELPEGFRLIKQSRNMRSTDVEDILMGLKLQEQPTLLFGVQGGIFSEGVDYAGEMVIGAFIIGPPLPVFDYQREGMKKYYQTYHKSGFEYAYTFPAMAKAIQAAGRVIRSETDRGLIILMDDRFLEKSFAQTMPSDWFSESPRELISKSILNDVAEFWKKG
ncbi:MAG TPA: ATP-dependent DNA helicase [Bacteriovoracaceae bacterium]|nr:ATP-dependent DNA helicase [Bacteriovoracaceae bacterium]